MITVLNHLRSSTGRKSTPAGFGSGRSRIGRLLRTSIFPDLVSIMNPLSESQAGFYPSTTSCQRKIKNQDAFNAGVIQLRAVQEHVKA